MTHASTADAPFAPPKNLVRLSVGIESADDLVADLAQALVPAAAHALARHVRLGAIVFIAGAATLAVEICASRLLAPFFGNSTVVWANVIGLILVYLSIGYWFGGRIADRIPQPRRARPIVLVAAARVAVIPFVARPFLDATVSQLDTASVGAVVGSFIAALALFAVPVTLLGTVSPFAIRLAVPSVEQAGTVAGRLYGLSTIGAILGTFARGDSSPSRSSARNGR